jgi:hypothetical protein
MSVEPDFGTDEEGVEADKQTTSMQDQLSKEVASWSKERRPQSSEAAIAPAPPATQPRSPQPAGGARKSSAAPLADKAPGARSKPFSMSYGGMTQEEYTQYLRDHGYR